jgi:long-subunit acyl-CoA synthetase (AMP-forming)
VGDETLARVFWSRVETSGDRPAQMTKVGGRSTPTQKVRRRIVAAKYQATIDALYRE